MFSLKGILYDQLTYNQTVNYPYPAAPASAGCNIASREERMNEIDQRQARVVEYRFFGGLDMQETAQALDISTRTAQRDWNIAGAWLHRELNGQAM